MCLIYNSGDRRFRQYTQPLVAELLNQIININMNILIFYYYFMLCVLGRKLWTLLEKKSKQINILQNSDNTKDRKLQKYRK